MDSNMSQKIRCQKILLLLSGVFLLSACDNLSSIPYCCPEKTPETWCDSQPCLEVRVGSLNFILDRPSETLIMVAMTALFFTVTISFFRNSKESKSKLWWGIGLALWSIASVLACVVYQAFTYEIRCAEKEICSLVSWWDVWFLFFQNVSLNTIGYAVALKSASRKTRRGLAVYAIVNSSLYSIVLFSGAFLAEQFLVSYEMMLLVTSPILVFLFFLNLIGYLKKREQHHDLVLVKSWLILLSVMVAYFAYLLMGMTEKVWTAGIWFSANDVMHIGLMIWLLHVRLAVLKEI